MFYSFIVMTSKKTSMVVNYLIVFFSLFLFTSPTQGKRISRDIFNHRQNSAPRFKVKYWGGIAQIQKSNAWTPEGKLNPPEKYTHQPSKLIPKVITCLIKKYLLFVFHAYLTPNQFY